MGVGSESQNLLLTKIKKNLQYQWGKKKSDCGVLEFSALSAGFVYFGLLENVSYLPSGFWRDLV